MGSRWKAGSAGRGAGGPIGVHARRGLALALAVLSWLLILPGRGAAQMTAAATGAGSDALSESVSDLTVNGPSGALLRVDGREVGTLPLLDGLRLPAGPHRFRIEQGNRRAESDILNLPGGRQAELNLTLAGRSLVAVLTITPAAVLWISPEPDAATRLVLQQVVAQAAKQEHVVLLPEARLRALQAAQPGLARCIEQADCAQPLAKQGELAYVLRLLPTAAELRLQLIDVRTRDIGGDRTVACAGCSLTQRAARVAGLAKGALQEIAGRARGQLRVTSSPSGALLRLDDRTLGQTPLAQEAFVGNRRLRIERRGYRSEDREIAITAGDTTTEEVTLTREGGAGKDGLDPAGDGGRRPLWRLVTGGGLLASGALLVGFGAAALAVNGTCRDPLGDPLSCSPYYQTTGVGAGLLAGGAALVVGGAVLVALPGKKAQ